MEVIAALAVVAFLIWIVAKGQKRSSTSPPRKLTRAPARPSAAAVARSAVTTESKSATSEECWVPPGQETSVAGYTIRGGMLYVGGRLPSVDGLRTEPALINPSLRINRSNPDRSGAGMTYWPSYSSISPESRAAYLDWLGRSTRSNCIHRVCLPLFLWSGTPRPCRSTTVCRCERGLAGHHRGGSVPSPGVRCQRIISGIRNSVT